MLVSVALYCVLHLTSAVLQKAFAEKDIFGSDSELSDAPDADGTTDYLSPFGFHIHILGYTDDIQRPPRRVPPIRIDEDESSAGESADDYEESAPKKKKKVRQRRREHEDEESVEGGNRRTTQRKRKRKPVPTEQDLNDLPPDEGPFPLDLIPEMHHTDKTYCGFHSQKNASRHETRCSSQAKEDFAPEEEEEG